MDCWRTGDQPIVSIWELSTTTCCFNRSNQALKGDPSIKEEGYAEIGPTAAGRVFYSCNVFQCR